MNSNRPGFPRLLVVGLCACLAAPATSCLAGSKVIVGRNIPPGARRPMDRIDHSAWSALLKKYVDANGNVDYAGWKRRPADLRALDGYLALLSAADPNARASRSARLAFWINAYNALTIKGILREYPTTSIRNHTAKLLGYNIWHDLLLVVGGQQYSLDTMEHKILRPMGEPRVHFAIVCASRSCPRLLNEAYTAERLDDQLAANARAFFARSGNFRYDARNGRFYLSSILKWFAGDFGNSPASQLQTIAAYLPTQTAQQAARAGSVRISYLSYDWSLNDQATARSAHR